MLYLQLVHVGLQPRVAYKPFRGPFPVVVGPFFEEVVNGMHL
jgi:hypothetical protein